MANYYTPGSDAQISRIFTAISDPTRRAVIEQLESGPQTVSALAEPLTIGLPTVLKHLGVLDDAGLIRREKKGRVVTVTLQPEPLREASAWLARYERFWSERLDRLGQFLEGDSK